MMNLSRETCILAGSHYTVMPTAATTCEAVACLRKRSTDSASRDVLHGTDWAKGTCQARVIQSQGLQVLSQTVEFLV